MRSKVSIIVPIYNAEKAINRCLDSILNQTYKNIEVLLINDGSTDKSLQVIKKYKDDRIKIIDKKNEGVAKTRNLGIKKATGKYIMFIDNDDFIEKDYVEKHLNTIEEKKVDVVISGYQRTDKNNNVLRKDVLKNTYWSRYLVISPWAKIFKRSFLIKNNVLFLSHPIGEDVYFNLLLYSFNPKIYIFDYVGYNWFYNIDSISNTEHVGLKKSVDIIYLLDKIKNDCSLDNYMNYYLNRFKIWYLLYSGRSTTSKSFYEEYMKLSNWFNANNIKTDIKPFSKKIDGETFKNRLIVFIFGLMEKFRFLRLFSKIYCKGGKQ